MGEQDQRVFWLNGTGKSTIAQTFAEISFADGKLGARFFFFARFREQATRIPTLIIIDALDECRDKGPASAILSVLSHYVNQVPQVKFFITGRPEPRIRSGFLLESLRPITEVLKPHDVERSSVDGDTKLFFRTRLTEIAKTRSDCDLTEGWPSAYDIDGLCKKAGLFIYASTVVKSVASQYHLPAERLTLTISLPQSTTHEGRSGIDLLYTQVLKQAFRDADSDERELYSRLNSVVGAVLLIFHPQPRKTFSELFRNCGSPSRISSALRSLHSLLLLAPNSEVEPVRIFHKSFPDFLTDPGRCEDERFFIDPPVHHTDILFSCLGLMKEKLKENICNLEPEA